MAKFDECAAATSAEAQRARIVDLCGRLETLDDVGELADAIGADRLMTYDLVIRGGRIVDGTGAPAFAGDVAITDGRIIEIGEVTGDAARTIDADGLVVAPGFIDAHTHYDAQLLWDPTANPSTAHGITTVLLGNCGYTLAPVRADDQDYLMGLFAAAEEIPKAALQQFAPLAWESFPEYLDWMDGRVGVNVLTQVGHSAVRRFVMGEEALERAATADEVDQMVRLVEEAMDAGAAGISSSQAPHQRGEQGEHIPSFFADDAETHALADAVRRKGGRLLSINPASKRVRHQRGRRGAAGRAGRALRCCGVVERLRHGHPGRRPHPRVHGGAGRGAAWRSTPWPAASGRRRASRSRSCRRCSPPPRPGSTCPSSTRPTSWPPWPTPGGGSASASSGRRRSSW